MLVRTLRSVAVASCLVLSVGLAGCGEDSSSEDSQAPVSAPATAGGDDTTDAPSEDAGSGDGLNPACAAFADTSRELAEAGSKLFAGTEEEIDKVIAALRKQLDAVKEGAPQSVKDAADDLKELYTALGEAAADPSGAAGEKLSTLSERVGSASQTVANYITSVCTR